MEYFPAPLEKLVEQFARLPGIGGKSAQRLAFHVLGLTQEAFADKIGRSWSYVSKIESPTRVFGVSMETLFKIAEVLEVPVSKLFEE